MISPAPMRRLCSRYKGRPDHINMGPRRLLQGCVRRGEGLGGLGPKSLCTKMARQDFPNGKFIVFLPTMVTLVWGGGGPGGGGLLL